MAYEWYYFFQLHSLPLSKPSLMICHRFPGQDFDTFLYNNDRPAPRGDKLIHPLSTYLHTNYTNTCYPLSFFGWFDDRVSTTVYNRIKIEQKTPELPFFAHFYFFLRKFNVSQLPGILYEQIHFKLLEIGFYCEGVRDETLRYKEWIFNTVRFRMYQSQIGPECYLQGVL